jgi:hypothetical protein
MTTRRSSPALYGAGLNSSLYDMLKTYHTGLLIGKSNFRYPSPPFRGKVWHITFSDNRTGHSSDQKEAIIHAHTRLAAQKALNLVLNALELYSGEPISPFGDPELMVYNEHDPVTSEEDKLPRTHARGFSTGGIPVACFIAAKASHRKKYVYALAKYNFSVSLYSQFRVDLEPWSSPHLSISSHPQDHIAFSYAIVSAYAVLEELGLEIRASSRKPSMINGKWNPDVKADLEHRLEMAGVNLSDKLLWTMRGPKRKIEKAKQVPIFEKMRWSSGPVRDSTVEVVDAIAYASWLRSFVSSHKVKEVTAVISPYDVINIQHLARRLMLEPFGIWRDFFRKLQQQ